MALSPRSRSRAASLLVGCGRLTRLKWLTVVRLKKSPHDIGLGMAFGVFVGFIPVIPMQSIWAIGLCLLFGGSKLAAFAGAWVSNPVTVPPLFTLFYYVGKLFFPEVSVGLTPEVLASDWLNLDFLMDAGWKLALLLNTGGMALGLPSALAAYLLTRHFSAAYQRRKARTAGLKRAKYGLA